jgi:GAF domain-containing protein
LSGEELRPLAQEQAALRRVATLVARGAPPEKVFAAVVEEVGRLLPVDLVSMARYEPDRTMTFVASWGRPVDFVPVGSRLSLGGNNLNTIVFETARPARIDSYAGASVRSVSPSARVASARRRGRRSSSRAACGA